MIRTSCPWICCQIGAREHYAIPRALNRSEALQAFVTEAWVKPRSPAAWLPRKGWRDRYHPDLKEAFVSAWNLKTVLFEARAKALRLTGWNLVIARNEWFQQNAMRSLRKLNVGLQCSSSAQPMLFSYSYAALRLFRYARVRGWRTVLGQIDPGPAEERLVADLHQCTPSLRSHWRSAPREYWKLWHEECRLADMILVNSQLSREGLVREGVAPEKIAVVPLTYQMPARAASFRRKYPAAFTAERPLRILFLGQVSLRKGIAPLLEVAALLKNTPVQFWIVGPLEIEPPREFISNPLVRWIGPVPRSKVVEYYREADVFLFPTFSDGFGMTQLEARAWRLPVIASRFCGEVVEPYRDGLLLDVVSGSAIAGAIRRLLQEPGLLARLATGERSSADFSLAQLAQRLGELAANQTNRMASRAATP
jgi:glycosyltransferase involved in cell wall biosynthesis